ncbi:thioredoxin domain-containing protein [Tsukamurella sp. NPDC003166]|uniref:DsbA family protein n=1 Tax=Tsukamurella sp. NPDC003166 TaxID=3154444 RepID=UPI0033BBF54B
MSKPKNAKYVPVKQSNTMTYVLGGIAVLVVIVVVIGGVLLVSKNSDKPSDQVASKLNAATPTFVLGKDDAKVTLDLFEDPLCPACGQMEQAYGEQIVQGIEAGTIKARYRMVSFLNQSSASGDYSDRANASFIAMDKSSMPADQKQKAMLAAHKALFNNQPHEKGSPQYDGKDHSNAEIATIVGDAAKAAGAELPADVLAAIRDGKYVGDSATAASANSKLMQDIGSSGTPTVVHNGELITVQGDWLTKLLS